MCFDVGIVTCGPNEALVISGMCQVGLIITVMSRDGGVLKCAYLVSAGHVGKYLYTSLSA